MRVLNSAQMREADRRTIEEIGIPSLVLMENAGRQVVAAMEAMYPDLSDRQVAVLCGRGHARMIATVRAVSPPEFDAWLAKQKQLITQANAAAQAARAKLKSQASAGQVENP